MNICYSGEEDEAKEESGNDDAEQMMMVRRTTMVPDSLMPNDDENLSRVPVGRTPTPKKKKKKKKRTREMMKVENTKEKKKKNTRRMDSDDDDTDDNEEEEEETMVVTNTQLTTPAKAQKTTRSLDAAKKSSSSHRHQHRQRMRSPLMETQKNATEEEEEEDSEEFKGRSLSPTAEFREAQKIAFNSTNEKKKMKEFKEYDDDDEEEEEETFDVLKKKEENLVNVNAYGETIRVADTLAIDNLNNNNNFNITEERDDDDDENNKTSTKKRRRGKVDFQFGDRHTEEQDFEDGKNGVVAVAETFTPIRETVPAPSGMHVCDDDDEEKETKEEKEADEKDRVLPLREIFRAKHLIDPRDASRTAPVLEVQVLRDESFFYQHVAARTTIQTIQTTTPKTTMKNHDHYLAYEIDHEIRDATEISVWKIETDACSSSSRRERSGSDDSKKMSRFSFKGTVLIGKPSARNGTSSSFKGGGGNGGGKTMKRWAFSIAPNGLVFTSSYKKSSLLSMMDETERTHGSNNSSDSDDSDDSDDEDTYLYGMNSAERRRRFPRKSGVYVHDPVDVNEEENVRKKDSSLGSEKKSNQSQKRRSSGRRRSKTPMDSFGNSMADTKKNQKTTKKQTYFELQSPGMAGKVRPRKFASAFSEEYDETVFRLAGVGAEGKCRLWTWSCENNEDFDDDVNDDDEKKMSSSSSKKKSKNKNRTKFSSAKICAKSVTHCKDFEIPTYKSHCVSRECEITSLSFSKDGNVLACVFDKKHVVVWDASTTRVVFSYYCTEYEIERDGLRVLDNNNKRMMKQRGQKSTPSRPNASGSKMKKKKSAFTTSADATSPGGGGPIFFFGNFRKISSSSDSSSPSSSVATFACAYNKELVVGPNASWENLKANNDGSDDIVSAVAVCPDVFVEEDDEEDEEEEDDEEEDEENDVKMIKAASKRNTTVNVVVTNAGRLGVFEAFGHANEATNAYEGLTFTKRHAFDEEDVNDDGKTNKSHQKKAFQGNFLCASHGNLFAVARKRPGCVSLYAQENHHQ